MNPGPRVSPSTRSAAGASYTRFVCPADAPLLSLTTRLLLEARPLLPSTFLLQLVLVLLALGQVAWDGGATGKCHSY
jgi:hypothetical protein